MARIIAISSGKGGVGKTTICANIACALSQLGHPVITVDSNLTTSNLGMHLGISLPAVTIQDVMRKKARPKDALYFHQRGGFHVLPADISVSNIIVPRKHDIANAIYGLDNMADYILLDCAAGLGRESRSSLEAADELITVTNPEMPAVTEALKLSNLAEKAGTRNLGVVINRVTKDSHEMTRREIEEFLELASLGNVFEDKNVKRAIANKMPVVAYRPNCVPAKQIKGIAARISGRPYNPGFIDRIFGRV